MQRSLLVGVPAAPAAAVRTPLAAKGFRPFFLAAALFAAVIVPLWLVFLFGGACTGATLEPTTWHAHEMIFGFAAAVIAGFLLTAVGNWTGRETLVGAPLLGLCALWIAGRLAVTFAAHLPRGVPAAIDLALLPLLIAALARPLVATKNRRNFVMLGILGALFAANVAMHLDALGVVAGVARRASLVAVDVVVLVVLVMTGRVVPMFTRNATGVASIRSLPALDAVAIASMLAVVVVDVLAPEGAIAAIAAAVAGVAAIARAAHWGTRHTWREPLLWILHAGHAWIAVGLVLRALAFVWPRVPASAATHALTVGAIGATTLGMMARVALGHTGRMLTVARPIAWAFGAVTAAAIVRVVAPIALPDAYRASLVVVGVLWSAAFLAYAIVYAPILTAPRTDGRPG